MFDNIGGKIKGLAKVICWVGIIASIVTGFAMSVTNENILPLLLIGGLGSVMSWVSSFFMYGFGELIDKACEIARNTSNGQIKSESQIKIDYERISKIEKLRSQGLITEEEYQQAVSKEQ